MTTPVQDIELILPSRPGALAELGRILGAAGVSLEGGGVFTHEGTAVAHFLVADGERAAAALHDGGLGPVRVHDVVTARLDQETPGQLGAFAQLLADAGIDILTQYSDHDHRLVVVVSADQLSHCRRLAATWDGEGRR